MVLPGFNTDFKHKGQVYHAQTEDNGVNNPVVVTLLYLKGAILASKKSSYAGLLAKENYQPELMELMKEQHRSIMREVLAGKFEGAQEEESAAGAAKEVSAAEEAAVAAAVDSLDRQIMEYLRNIAESKEDA